MHKTTIPILTLVAWLEVTVPNVYLVHIYSTSVMTTCDVFDPYVQEGTFSFGHEYV
jgi:hypothetical protein